MSVARRRRPWRPLLALTVLLAAIAVGGVLLLGGDDEDDPYELGALRTLPGVEAAAEDDDDVLVRLRPGTDARRIAAVAGRAPREADRTMLRLGRASLEVESGTTVDAELIDVFVALSGTGAPGGTLEIDPSLADRQVSVEVRRPEQAAPLAREIVARLTPGGRKALGIDRVRVSLASAASADADPVVLRGLSGTDGRAQTAVLDAAVALAARRPRVSMTGAEGELQPLARGLADVGTAWREAAAALDAPEGGRGDLRISVDTPDGPTRSDRRTVVSGPADSRPDRALALLRSFGAARKPFLTTDLSYARAETPGPAGARRIASAAVGAGLERLSVIWPTVDAGGPSGSRAGSVDAAGDDDGSAASLLDAPEAILGLLPGVARAHRLGIDEVRWAGGGGVDAPLQVAPPRWLDPGTRFAERPRLLRRYLRAIRAIGWSGTARLGLGLGRGSCDGYASAQGVAQIRSTADGRARTVKPVGECTREDAVRAARRAWDATAR